MSWANKHADKQYPSAGGLGMDVDIEEVMGILDGAARIVLNTYHHASICGPSGLDCDSWTDDGTERGAKLVQRLPGDGFPG
jgi:hypothetical protein